MVKAIDLLKEQKERDKIKKKIYKKIYKKVEKKIIQTSKVNLSECWFQLPEFMINIPLYNLDDSKNYIMNKLKENGFKSESLSNNIIFISWKE